MDDLVQSVALTNHSENFYTQSVLTLDHSPVHFDPELMGGTVVFRGTCVPAQSLLDYLDDGFSLEEFLQMFPSVAYENALGFLQLARDARQ